MKKKRALTLLLTFSMLMSNVVPAYAVDTNSTESVVDQQDMELVNETEAGSAELETIVETIEETVVETELVETESGEVDVEETQESESETVKEDIVYEIKDVAAAFSELEAGSKQTITIYMESTENIEEAVLRGEADDEGVEHQYECTRMTETELVFEIIHSEADLYTMNALDIKVDGEMQTFDLNNYEELKYFVGSAYKGESVSNGISFFSNRNSMYTGVNGDDGKFVIVLDPGHDPVCNTRGITNGVWETELNWIVAEAMVAELEQYPYVEVYINRVWNECPEETDGIDDLKARAIRAANLNADLFISLHQNALGSGALQSSAKGAEIFVTGYSQYHEEVKGVAEMILEELEDFGLTNRGTTVRYTTESGRYDDGTKQDYYGVIKQSTLLGVPAMLIEHAFMDNSYDLTFLKDKEKVKEIGRRNAKAIIEYYDLQLITEPVADVSVKQYVSGTVEMDITKALAPFEFNKVAVSVRSAATVEESLKWFDATGNKDTWEVSFNVNDYNMSAGDYVAELYYINKKGEYILVNATNFSVAKQPEFEMSVANENAANGTFEILVNTDLSKNSDVTMYVEAWTSADKSDCYKYKAERQADGNYKVKIDVKNHKHHIGEYKITCMLDESGKVSDVDSITHTLALQAGEMVSLTAEDGYSVKVTLNDVKTQGISNQIAFMVWSSENGKDDIKSYIATFNGGNCFVEVPLYNHKDSGTYQVHVYMSGKDGNMHFLKSTTFEVEELPKSEISVVASDSVKGTFDVTTYINMPQNMYESVYVEAWTTSDQSDVYRYEGKLQNDGTYDVQVDVKNHSYHTGEYKVRAYVVDAQNERIDVAELVHEVKVQEGTLEASLSEDGYSMELTLNNVEVQGTANWLTFFVWSEENDQDDIVGYASLGDGDTYTVSVPLYNHKDAGKYQVHVYIGGKDGKLHFLTKSTFEVAEIPESKMEVKASDGVKGTFDVNAHINMPKDKYEKVYVEAWTTGNKSDLHCYEGQLCADGSYAVQINVKNHSYHTGEYKLVCYVTDAKGNRINVAEMVHEVKTQAGELNAVLSEDGYSMELTLNDVEVQGTARWLTVFVWSEENGQDDIVGYGSVGTGNDYTLTIPLYNHKDTGTYNAHVYICGQDGKLSFLKSYTFEVAEIPESKMEVKASNGVKGTFDVNAYINMPKDKYENVYVEAWTTENKSDLHCYEGQLRSDGSYAVQVNVKNHSYHTGEYKLVCYVTDAKGNRINVTEMVHEVKTQAGELNAVLSEDGYSMELTLNDVEVQGTARWLTFFVWSEENGQDDIVGYGSVGTGNDYTLTMPLYNHKDTGTYNAHVYICGQDGKLSFLKSYTFVVDELPKTELVVVSSNGVKGTFDVSAYINMPKGSFENVYVEAWTMGDKSDLYLHEGKLQTNGTYSVQVDVKNHNYHTGVYQLKCYVTDAQGKRIDVAEAEHEVIIKSGDVSASLSKDGYSMELTLNNVEVQGTARWLTFYVWSDENGQDDITGYAVAGSGTSYTVRMPLHNHGDLGTYNVHVYVYGVDGKQHFLKASTFEVTELPKSAVTVDSADDVNGTFNVSAYVDMAKSEFENVYVEAWTAEDQSDLYRYEGKLQSNGTYDVQVNVKNHSYHTGVYQLKCYVTDAKGKRTDVAETTYEVVIQAGEFKTALSKDGFTMEVTLNDVKTQGTANSLAFMVWSDKGGQDDIKSYVAVGNAGTYTAFMQLYNHKDVGTYTVHVYMGGKDGKLHFLKASSFTVDELPKEYIQITNVSEINGTFDANVRLARELTSVTQVYVHAWTKSDQSDMVKYVAAKQSDGSFKATVDATKHKWRAGTYNVYAYVKTMQGSTEFVAVNSVVMNLPELPPKATPHKISNFNVIYQEPELPTGCEVVSLTMALNYYGYSANKVTMAKNYLPKKAFVTTRGSDGKLYGPDLDKYFVGDPFGRGTVCGPEALVTAANAYLKDVNANMKAKDITGATCEELYKRVSLDQPVVVMTTIGNANRATPSGWYTEEGKYVNWSTNDHGVVLIGWDETYVTVACPLYGMKKYSRVQFEKVYASRGYKAMVLESK